MLDAYDPETLAFYEREAVAYAAHREAKLTSKLSDFIARVGAGGRVLELGTGGGQDAALLLSAGIDVEPTDGCAKLAALATERLGRAVRVMRFDELEAVAAYDGVWANACLLHVPAAALPGVLKQVWGALKTGGVLFASFKAGECEGRDRFGRYYNYPSADGLRRTFEAGGAWRELTIEENTGRGYDGVATIGLVCTALK